MYMYILAGSNITQDTILPPGLYYPGIVLSRDCIIQGLYFLRYYIIQGLYYPGYVIEGIYQPGYYNTSGIILSRDYITQDTILLQ